MKPLPLVLAAVLVAPAFAIAADALETLGLERRDVEHSLLTLLAKGDVWAPAPKKAVRSMSGVQRAEAIKALGALAKAWTKTEDFKARYAQERQATLPKQPVAARDGAKVAAEQKAQMEKSLKDAEQAIAALPPDQRGPAMQALKAAQQQLAQSAPPDGVREQQEKERFAQEQAAYDQALAKAMPQDPKEGLRMRLKTLLERTDKVDFKAKLVADGGMQRFASKDLEAKPAEWKLCFRLGKEACEAGRGFLQGWIAELK
ncbi:MAG: hypothetical protein QM765_42775 [Myxococcales bacterium]